MFVVCLTVFGLAGSSGAALYHYQDLTPQGIPVGEAPYYFNAINDAKQIVGYYSQIINGKSVYQAFLWDPAKGLILLKSLGTNTSSCAYGINKQGQIVGMSDTGFFPNIVTYQACLWGDPSAAPTNLSSRNGTINNPTSSCAYAINDNGLIVGYDDFGTPPSMYAHACKWTVPQPPSGDLGTLGGYTSIAKGVNNVGQIVGQSDTTKVVATDQTHACLWNPGQSAQDLSPSIFGVSVANLINNQGNIAGSGVVGAGDPQAFYWDHQTETSVTNIAPQLERSTSGGISDSNQVVGSGWLASYNPPFVFWNPIQGTQDLNKMVVNLPQGVTIAYLYTISPKGYIMGADSQTHACLLTPIAGLPGLNLLLME